MSKLVILEGFLNQQVKNKDTSEIYAVLTASNLKIYRSMIAYQQHPNQALRSLDFSSDYNIIPMPIDKSHMFSIFRRGEKADERLYLESVSKSEYDLWISSIDTIINKKSDSSTRSPGTTDTETVVPQESPATKSSPVTIVDTPVSPRGPNQKFIIRNNSPTTEMKQLQQASDKLEVDWKREKKNASDALLAKEELEKKLLKLEGKVAELEKENKSLLAKMNKDKDAEKFNDSQLKKASIHICKDLKSLDMNPSSYECLINHLLTDDPHSPVLTSFLRHQLEFLIHRSPVQIGSDQSLFQYLSHSIIMSCDSITAFTANFLTTLATQINPTNTHGDLHSNLQSIIRSVVEMNPCPQLSTSSKSFQQTALEIAYLIAPRDDKYSHLSNGYSSEPPSVTEQFNEVVKGVSGESVVSKILVIDLCNLIRDKCRSEVASSNAIQTGTDDVTNQNPVQDHFNDLWNKLHNDLYIKQQEVDDLHVTLHSFSMRIIDLEKECSKSREIRNLDSYVNYYTSLGQDLCPQCQIKLCDKLKLPVSSVIDAVVDEFTSYWMCFNDLVTLLSKKKIAPDAKEMLDMTKKCTLKYEALVKLFQQLSLRTITNPGGSKTQPPTANEQ